METYYLTSRRINRIRNQGLNALADAQTLRTEVQNINEMAADYIRGEVRRVITQTAIFLTIAVALVTIGMFI